MIDSLENRKRKPKNNRSFKNIALTAAMVAIL
jgi:hypothetical protein